MAWRHTAAAVPEIVQGPKKKLLKRPKRPRVLAALCYPLTWRHIMAAFSDTAPGPATDNTLAGDTTPRVHIQRPASPAASASPCALIDCPLKKSSTFGSHLQSLAQNQDQPRALPPAPTLRDPCPALRNQPCELQPRPTPTQSRTVGRNPAIPRQTSRQISVPELADSSATAAIMGIMWAKVAENYAEMLALDRPAKPSLPEEGAELEEDDELEDDEDLEPLAKLEPEGPKPDKEQEPGQALAAAAGRPEPHAPFPPPREADRRRARATRGSAGALAGGLRITRMSGAVCVRLCSPSTFGRIA